MEKIEIDETDLKELAIAVCKLGESLGHEPRHFAIMLGMVAKIICDGEGIEVHGQRILQS